MPTAGGLVGALALAGALVTAVAGCGGGDEGGDTLASSLGAEARRGREVADDTGCTSCHSSDGSRRTGPTWRELWGTTVDLDGGGTVTVDRAYVARSIREPNAEIVDGFAPVMPQLDVSDDEIDAIVAYMRALG